MSELVGGAAATETSMGSAAEAGAILRRAREALGLRIEVLAASLKVPVAKLEALESGLLESLSDRVFVRALAASVCRHVKIDPALVLSKLPAASQSAWANPKTATNTAVKRDDGHQRRSLLEYLSRPVALAVLALLVGAAAITFWPELRASGLLSSTAPATSELTAPVVLQDVPAAPREVVVAVVPLTPASAAMPPAAPVVTPAPAPVAAVAAPELLVLRAKADSWVRVMDAKNVIVLQKTMAAGETASVAGAVPLAVTIGRADAVDVQVRGQPMDMATVATGTVARFAVK